MLVNRNPVYWIDRRCRHCRKKFPARTSDVKRGRMKYCSPSCSNLAQRIKEHVEFGGDTFYINDHGYYVSSKTGRALNRAMWEAHHGPIPDGHRVCVTDGVRSNYAIENLSLKRLQPRPLCSIEECGRKAWRGRVCQKHLHQLA